MLALIVEAPAKVNLFLGIGEVRADGHHNLGSVFHTLALHDTLRVTPSDSLTVSCDGLRDLPPEQNLAFRAARAFAEAFQVEVLVDIAIEKRIPAGAGLAGGSSDAAAVLACLAHWAGVPLDDERLLRAARQLGADVPFFLYGGAALMGGRGDELVSRLTALAFDVAIVKPQQPVPTAEAYRAFDVAPVPADDAAPVIEALERRDVRALGAALANNMTAASASLVPEVGDALAWLQGEPGVVGALVAGSGSAVFGICEDRLVAQRIAADATARGWWSAATASRAAGVHVIEGEEHS